MMYKIIVYLLKFVDGDLLFMVALMGTVGRLFTYTVHATIKQRQYFIYSSVE